MTMHLIYMVSFCVIQCIMNNYTHARVQMHLLTCMHTYITETSVEVVCCYVLYMFYLQDRALFWVCYHNDLVRTQELLSLGANVHCHNDDWVSYM